MATSDLATVEPTFEETLPTAVDLFAERRS